MEKITLEELTPYLPYKLLVTREDWDNIFVMIAEDAVYKIKDKFMYRMGIDEILRLKAKPLLRPMTDLFKEIDHNGDVFIPKDMLEYVYGDISRLTDTMQVGSWVPYGIVKKLFEWHFDVFGLIERNLALDINNEPNNE